MTTESLLDEEFSVTLPCIKVSQPLGDFYVTTISAQVLRQITFADVRQMQEREMDTYLGIQREVSPKRVRDIGEYVNTVDACFPTAVILAVEARCASYDDVARTLTLHTSPSDGETAPRVKMLEIARVLDGQHRIEGLQYLRPGETFELNVSIFVDMDIESQAYLFSVVNLAQTKVNKSLAYDLFDYARARSPQKTAHNVAVALDRDPKSPLFQRIKRLGRATKGRFNETLTQATVVEALMPYLSAAPVKDRQVFLKGHKPKPIGADELRKFIFRNMFLAEEDLQIAEILYNYFSAAKKQWPTAWDSTGDGAMLTKTNGFKALMRFLRPAYLYCTKPGAVVTLTAFAEIFARAESLQDSDFSVDNFKPGSSGELGLYRRLLEECQLDAAPTN
jgi:DGQHR domain-containing protein